MTIEEIKIEWFKMYSSIYALHLHEEAFEKAEIAYEGGLIMRGEILGYAYSALLDSLN